MMASRYRLNPARQAPRSRHSYAGGRSYRALHSPLSEQPKPYDCRNDKVIALTSPELSWPRFWQIVYKELGRHAYSESTTALYRSIMRGFYRHARRCPAAVEAATVQNYIDNLVDKDYSWAWIGMNISVLRSVFDKLGGKDITSRLATPKRPLRLPEILSRGEARAVLAAAPTTRDQLLLGLMYGCGLKVGEVCRLKWADVDTVRQVLRVRYSRGTRERTLPIPSDLVPVLRLGVNRCLPACVPELAAGPAYDYVFQGRWEGTHLSTRMAELIVRKAARCTGTLKTVTSMTLRHSYAVHCMEDGCSARTVQEALGHCSIDTTLLYEHCIIPPDVASPVDALARRRREHCGTGAAPRSHATQPPALDRKLFDRPLSLDALDLPFRDNLTNGLAAGPPACLRELAAGFHRLLKTSIVGRFLCARRATTRAG